MIQKHLLDDWVDETYHRTVTVEIQEPFFSEEGRGTDGQRRLRESGKRGF